MALEGIDTKELIQNAKADASSIILVVTVLVVSLFIAWIVSRIFDKYLEEHLSDALWLQENRKKVKLIIRSGGSLVLTLMILSVTNVFTELSWVLAPLAAAGVYMGRKTLQNMAEHFALVVEGKIQLSDFIQVENPDIKLNALGRIFTRTSRKSFFKTVDGGEIIIRNHDLFESRITNYAHSTIRRICIKMQFPIIHSIRELDEITTTVLKNQEYVLTQYPIDPLLDRIHDANYQYSIYFWISKDDSHILKIKQEAKKAIYAEVKSKQLGLPYFHQDLSYTL